MSWRWLALRDDEPEGAEAVVPVRGLDGGSAGNLAVWPEGAKRPRGGRRIDARAIDTSGDEALMSLVLLPDGTSLDFDDPSVVGATRAALELFPFPEILSTLIVEKMRFGGAVTVARGDVRTLEDDPFGRIAPARLLRVGAGLFGSMPPPVGPGTQRYGGGQPWPWDRFHPGVGMD